MLPYLARLNRSLLARRADLPAAHSPTALQLAVWGLVLMTGLALCLLSYTSFQVGAHGDDAAYVVLSRSFLQSDYFGLFNRAGPPVPTQFPFGWPLVLVPLAAAFPTAPEPMKSVSLILTLVNAALLFWGWRWLSPRSSYWWGIAVSGLALVWPMTVGEAGMIMSEPLFMTGALVSILLAERAARGRLASTWIPAMSVGLFLVLYSRFVGVILFVTIIGYLLLTRGRVLWKQLLLVLAGFALLVSVVVAVTPVQLRDLWPQSYLNQIDPAANLGSDAPDQFVPRVLNSAGRLDENVWQTVFASASSETIQMIGERAGLPALPEWLGFLTSAVILWGYVAWWRFEGPSLFKLFPLVYATVMPLYPFLADTRYVYPIVPQIYLAFLLGIASLLRAAGRIFPRADRARMRFGLLVLVVLTLAALSVFRNLRNDSSQNHVGDLAARSAWLLDHAGPSDVVLTEEPEIDYLYGHVKTIRKRSFASTREFEQFLASNQVDLILVAPEVKWQQSYRPTYSATAVQWLARIQELVAQRRAQLIYSSGEDGVRIYKVGL